MSATTRRASLAPTASSANCSAPVIRQRLRVPLSIFQTSARARGTASARPSTQDRIAGIPQPPRGPLAERSGGSRRSSNRRSSSIGQRSRRLKLDPATIPIAAESRTSSRWRSGSLEGPDYRPGADPADRSWLQRDSPFWRHARRSRTSAAVSTGGKDLLVVQLIRLLGKSFFRPRSSSQSRACVHQDPLRKRILISLSIDRGRKQHLLPVRCHRTETSNGWSQIFDEEFPIGSTTADAHLGHT